MSPPDKRRKRRNARLKASLPAVIDPRAPQEAAFVAADEAVRQDRTQCAPKMRIQESDGVVIPHTDDVALWRAQFAAARWVRDRDAQTHLVTQLACVFREGAADTNANAATALIREIGPRNAVEALLITQMIAVNNAAHEQLRRVINHLYWPPEVIDSLSNQATRLMHGGRSLSGTAHGRYRHGQATREAIAMRRYLTALVRDARTMLTGLRT